MSHALKVLAALGVVMALASRPLAQGVVMQRNLSLGLAKTIAEAALAAQRDIADILALGGGVPIQVGTDVIGGVGSSGSSQEQDDACAKAGVAKVADLLK